MIEEELTEEEQLQLLEEMFNLTICDKDLETPNNDRA